MNVRSWALLVFYETPTNKTLPGMDHACFQRAVTARTVKTCAFGRKPLSEYACRSWPSWESCERVRGKEAVMGREKRPARTSMVDKGKRMMTRKIGAYAWVEV